MLLVSTGAADRRAPAAAAAWARGHVVALPLDSHAGAPLPLRVCCCIAAAPNFFFLAIQSFGNKVTASLLLLPQLACFFTALLLRVCYCIAAAPTCTFFVFFGKYSLWQ